MMEPNVSTLISEDTIIELENNDINNEEVIIETPNEKSRKRKPNPQIWKRNLAKKAR